MLCILHPILNVCINQFSLPFFLPKEGAQPEGFSSASILYFSLHHSCQKTSHRNSGSGNGKNQTGVALCHVSLAPSLRLYQHGDDFRLRNHAEATHESTEESPPSVSSNLRGFGNSRCPRKERLKRQRASNSRIIYTCGLVQM